MGLNLLSNMPVVQVNEKAKAFVLIILCTIGGGSCYEVGGLATDDQLLMHA